jgi:hypothetical protein
MLSEAGVRNADERDALALIGYESPGLAIPYRTIAGEPLIVGGNPFFRLRLLKPAGKAKYLSRAKSGCQLYIPPRLRALLVPGCTLGVVEGEFKAMALVEAGFPSVGIGGITASCPKNDVGDPVLLPALVALIAEVQPSMIAFIGDSDTALNADFAREAVKLAQLAGVSVSLPRTPLDAPGKGPDDLRDIWGADFPSRWQAILAAAEPVTGKTKPSALAVRLLKREAESFGRLDAEARESACTRLVRFGATYRADSLTFEEIVTFAASNAGLGKQTFRSAVREETKLQTATSNAAHAETVARKFADSCANDPLYFDGRAYWRKERDGGFGQLCREDVRLHLGVQGFSLFAGDGSPSPADRALHRLQLEARVGYAGPICGRSPGLLVENGLRVLVTRGPHQIEPKAGECPTISELIGNLFGRAARDPLAPTQGAVFLAWLQFARAAVRNPNEHRPGQVLGLVGPPDCGKSLLQSAIITPALGGRVADPALWFTGATSFSSDLWSAEHLAIGDKGLGEDGRERARLRDELKRVTAASEYPLHAKHREALTLRPIWRVTLSANDDPESAASLPALDASFEDKIIYLQCFAPPAPFFNEDEPGARARFAKALADELPAFLAHVDAFEIPAELRKARFGVREFHHPKIIDLIESGSPLVPLGEALESWIESWDLLKPSVEMPSVELYAILDEHLDNRLRPISSGPKHLGHQLARLGTLENWRGRIIRGDRRIGNRTENRRQTVWTVRRDPAAA